MIDIVERLNALQTDIPSALQRDLHEAADEIERLRAELRAILAVSERHNNATCNVISDVARRALAESSAQPK